MRRAISACDREMVSQLEVIEAKYDIVCMVNEGKRDEAVAKMNAECRPLLAALLKVTNDVIDCEHAPADARAQAASSAYAGDRTVVRAALKKMNGSLVDMVGKVRQSADGIATASAEIAMDNQDLSSRTELHRAAGERTAADGGVDAADDRDGAAQRR